MPREDYAVEQGAYQPDDKHHRLTWYGGSVDATLDYYPLDRLAALRTGTADVMPSGPFAGHRVVWRGTYVEVRVVDGEALPTTDELRRMGVAGGLMFFQMWKRMKELVGA